MTLAAARLAGQTKEPTTRHAWALFFAHNGMLPFVMPVSALSLSVMPVKAGIHRSCPVRTTQGWILLIEEMTKGQGVQRINQERSVNAAGLNVLPSPERFVKINPLWIGGLNQLNFPLPSLRHFLICFSRWIALAISAFIQSTPACGCDGWK